MGRIENIDAKAAAGVMAAKLQTSEALRNHFKGVLGVQGYEKFIKHLQSVETTSHLLHAAVMLPVSGVAAMIALGALFQAPMWLLVVLLL